MIDFVFRKKYLTVFILLFLAAALLIFGLFKLNNQIKPGLVEDSAEQENWVKYTNKQFGFTVSFPKDWKLYEDLSNFNEPKINIYRPTFKINLPLDHFSNEDQFSIFPKGLESDPIMGHIQNVDFGLNLATDRSFDYILKNGKAWASFITFKEHAKTWQPWGFIWLGSKVSNLEYSCRGGTEIISLEECNIFEGDILERAGETDSDVRATQLKILKTFQFID